MKIVLTLNINEKNSTFHRSTFFFDFYYFCFNDLEQESHAFVTCGPIFQEKVARGLFTKKGFEGRNLKQP